MKLKFTNINLIYLIGLILFFIAGCSSSDNGINNEANVKMPNEIITEPVFNSIIVAFGDSLTEGLYVNREDAYPAQLQRALDNENYTVKVFNSGLSGETTSAALARTDWVLKLNPDIVILEIGVNDAIRGIGLNLTKNNIKLIVQKLKENDIKVILAGMVVFENLGPEYVEGFESMYGEIAKNENITLIPNFLAGVAGNSSLNNRDEIHPTAIGYELIVRDNVLPYIKQVLN
jgi:acyl-CoA thioesterase-1